MISRKRILIVDDSTLNRALLRHILSAQYDIIEAEDGKTALELLFTRMEDIAAVLLDIVMPDISGYEVLAAVRERQEFAALPIMVMTQLDGHGEEIRALELGATDFVSKPYQPEVLRQRLSNILLLSEAAALRHTVERDALTGLYAKDAFYARAAATMQADSSRAYVIATLDIDHFKLVNDLFGAAQGDKLLRHVADSLLTVLEKNHALCARLDRDHFAVCTPQSADTELLLTRLAHSCLTAYPLDMKLAMRLGLYTVQDISVPVNLMCDRALLAGASIKGKCNQICAHYTEAHRQLLLEEQAIVNSMHEALAREEFQVYFHPKYSLQTMHLMGAEALVRWQHPQMGMLTPERFISIFEKNGFISAMDEYVWTQVCRQLRRWLDAGVPVVPLSVNVSRVDIYHPRLCTLLQNLLHTYRLPPHMLRLEVTESACTDNITQLSTTINALRAAGFVVEMDDFGSGYSSLNMLKDIPVDVLKIDLRFLENSQETLRGTSILASVIRMARWLHIPVLAEGVENVGQVAFLRSVGCAGGQGTYFGRAMPAQNFEALLRSAPFAQGWNELPMPDGGVSPLWRASDEFSWLFNALPAAVCMAELHGSRLETLRVNERYLALFPETTAENPVGHSLLDGVAEHDRRLLLRGMHAADRTRRPQVVQYRRRLPDGRTLWIEASMYCLTHDNGSLLLSFMLRDMTLMKRHELRLLQRENGLARTAPAWRPVRRLPRVVRRRAAP